MGMHSPAPSPSHDLPASFIRSLDTALRESIDSEAQELSRRLELSLRGDVEEVVVTASDACHTSKNRAAAWVSAASRRSVDAPGDLNS
jgi:hypothetical protein